MFVIKRKIEGVIKDAFETECDDKEAIDEKSRKEIAMKRASRHVRHAYRGVDIISQCQLECINNGKWSLLSTLFKIRNHYLWTIFMHCIVITHVALSFIESKTRRSNKPMEIFGRPLYLRVWYTFIQ